MSGPLANLPVGLLDSLGIKSGSYPRTLLEDIRPILDLWEIVAVNNATEILTSSTTVNVTGLVNTFVVPSGETWLVPFAGLAGTTLVGEAIVIRQVLRANSGTNFTVGVRTWPSVGSRTAAVSQFNTASDGPFWLNSGSAIGYQVETITTAGTIAITHNVVILRCRR